jgi:hypothetical protein
MQVSSTSVVLMRRCTKRFRNAGRVKASAVNVAPIHMVTSAGGSLVVNLRPRFHIALHDLQKPLTLSTDRGDDDGLRRFENTA